jgi:hypothetical protein
VPFAGRDVKAVLPRYSPGWARPDVTHRDPEALRVCAVRDRGREGGVRTWWVAAPLGCRGEWSLRSVGGRPRRLVGRKRRGVQVSPRGARGTRLG